MTSDYMQFGCGTDAPASWLNFDAGPAFLLEKRFPFLKTTLIRRGFPDYPDNIKYGDVIRGLPVSQDTFQGVYCSHVLEHLSLEDCRKTLRNVLTYLRPGGVFRLVLPDLEQLARTYLQDQTTNAAGTFMVEAHLGEASSPRGVRKFSRAVFGRSQHLWMWDYRSMSHELRDAGFADIRRAVYGDSQDSHFSDVEASGRWKDCLGIECRRPLVSPEMD